MKKLKNLLFVVTLALSMTFSVIELPVPVRAETMCYITPTGSKYHSKQCGRGNYSLIELSKAISMGLEPCSKCWVGGVSGSGGTDTSTSNTNNSQSTNSGTNKSANSDVKKEDSSASDKTKKSGTGKKNSSKTDDPTKGIKVTSVKVSKDGSSITFKIKNNTKKEIIVDARCFVADSEDSGFAWCDTDLNPVTIKSGKSKKLTYVAYPGYDWDDYPTSYDEVEYDRETMGGMLYMAYDDDVIFYAYIYNPETGVKKVKKWTDDSIYYLSK